MNMLVDYNKMTAEEQVRIEMQNLANNAVSIAKHVTDYVRRECHKKINYGCSDPFMLEEMALSYAIAMSNFSLFKVLPHDAKWEEFEAKAMDAVKIAFDHVKTQMDKEREKCN